MSTEGRTEREPVPPGPRITIIAEGAQGYEGDPTIARLLIRAAEQATAEAIKFQLVYADELATPDYPYYGIFKRLEMPAEAWRAVAGEARARGLDLVFDVFGQRSLAEAAELGAAGVKIHATDFFNRPLLNAALDRAQAVYLSAGGITVDEIGELLGSLGDSAARKLTLMYGFQAEPTATADNHLARLLSLRTAFPSLRLGFMDHSDGATDEAAWLGVLAVPLGVAVIEKHLTLDRSLALEDSVSALTAAEFAAYARRIRSAEAALGSASTALTPAEAAYRRRALKVAVTTRSLAAGTRIASGDVEFRRVPLDAARQPVWRLEQVVGHRLGGPAAAGQPVYVDEISE